MGHVNDAFCVYFSLFHAVLLALFPTPAKGNKLSHAVLCQKFKDLYRNVPSLLPVSQKWKVLEPKKS